MNENPTLVEPLGTGPEPGADGATTENAQNPPSYDSTAGAQGAPGATYPPAGGYFAPVTPPRPPLRRSRNDRVIAGVCGGFAQQYGIDPVLVRILLVVLTIFTGGLFALAYLVAWIAMPDEPLWTATPMPGAPAGTAYAPVQTPVPPSYAAGGTGTYVDPATGAVYGAPQYYAPAKPREPRSFLGLIALSASVVVGGLLAILAVAGVDMPVATVAAAMLAVLAIGLLVGAFRGKARWLIAPAIVLLLVAQAATAIPRAVSSSWGSGVGDRTWSPTVSQPAPFELGAGSAKLDLTSLPAGPATVSAKLGLGQLVVVVRGDTTVVLHGRIGAGDVILPGEPTTDGTSMVLSSTVDATTAADPRTTVDLTVDIGLGELEVRHASS